MTDRRMDMVVIKKLDNGVRVVLEEIEYVRSISFGIWVRNGSRNEQPENNGMSHFIEHMLFKGTENRTARQIAQEMDAVGGQINAYTTKEYTCYHTKVLDTHFDKALDVMSDMFLGSRFSQEDIQKERNVILEEISMYEDAPEELVHDALQEAIWKDCSLGQPILGTAETISKFDTAKMKNFFQKQYHTQNTVIAVAGHFDTEEMLSKLNQSLGQWQRKTDFVFYVTKTIYTPQIVKKEKEIEQVHLCMAFPALERDHPQKYALAVFNTIFGGGMSSRLFQKIREEHGLTYTIYSYTSAYVDSGMFSIYGGMNPNQTEKVVSLVCDEIRDLKKNKISQELIDVTKEQIISNFIIGKESTVNLMTASGASVLLRGFVQDTDKILEQIQKITAEDIQNVIEKIFVKENMSISVVGNLKNISFDKILENNF